MDEERAARMLGEMEDKASVRVAFGDSRQVGDKTIIPVAQVAWGGGFGFGRGPGSRREPQPSGGAEGEAAGGGLGGGIRVRPMAVVEVSPTETKVRPIVDTTAIALSGILLGAWNVFWITSTLRSIFSQRGKGLDRPSRLGRG